jgi:hypothetical protein
LALWPTTRAGGPLRSIARVHRLFIVAASLLVALTVASSCTHNIDTFQCVRLLDGGCEVGYLCSAASTKCTDVRVGFVSSSADAGSCEQVFEPYDCP